MKRATIILCGVFSMLLTMVAQATADDASAEILRTTKSYDAAILARDVKAFEKLFHPDGVFIDFTGVSYDKAGYITAYVEEKKTLETAECSQQKLRFLGDSHCIETGVWTATGKLDGKPFTDRMRYTAVWTKLDGHWTLFSEQGTPIAETAK